MTGPPSRRDGRRVGRSVGPRIGPGGLLGVVLLLLLIVAGFDLIREESFLRGLFTTEPRTAPEELIRRIRGGIRQPSR